MSATSTVDRPITGGRVLALLVVVLLVALCFGVVGWALEYYVPGATTMGEAFHGAKK